MTIEPPIREYFKQIEAGGVIVSKRVRRIYARLVAEMDAPGAYIFNEERAARPIEFIEQFCRHSKGEWARQPVKLELYQRAYIAALFGFVDAVTSFRRYRESLFLCGRKNGKSTLLSGIALYMLIADHESGSEVYSIATKKDQAKLVFDEACNMVRQSPDLSRNVHKRKMDLFFDASLSKLQALGKNSDTLDGLNSHLIIVDELHGIKDRQLYEVMQQSQSARRQPMLIMITTAGTVRECIFDDMYNYACNIADGKFEDERFLPVLYELDNRDEWRDPAAWMKANPGLGIIKKLDDLERKVEKAKNSLKDLSGILTKDFNIRDTVTTAWLSFDDIHNEAEFNIKKFRNCYAIGGADLSITTDLTCATLLMIEKDTGERCIHQMYWLPADNLPERVQRDKIPYDIWLARGLLRVCTGNSICYMGLCNAPSVAVFGDKLLYHLTCDMRTLHKNATVGEKIRFYRMKRNIHGHILAEGIGLSRYAIMYYENHQSEPLLEDLKKMATFLDIEPDKLYDDYYRFLDYPYSMRIKELRKERNFLQRELGKILGVDRRTVEKWEHGKSVISRDTWGRLQELNLL